MSTAENALDRFNLVVERASKVDLVVREMMEIYLEDTKDPPAKRKKKIAHAKELRLIAKGLTDFRKLFHQNLLAAIAQVYVAFDQDPELTSVIITVKKSGIKNTLGATYHIPVTLPKR